MSDEISNISHVQYRRDESEEEEEEDREEAEEALSLCDLPLDNIHDQSHLQARRSSSDQLFEFFSDMSSDSFMCSAEDIIVCGKLIPFKQKTPDTQIPQAPKPTSFRKRSESLPGLQSSALRSGSGRNQIMMRNSRSLDYRKLHRQSSMVSSTPAEMERNSSVKGIGKSEKKSTTNTTTNTTGKGKWFFLMFGVARFPAEMDLGDIKSRQFRRNPSTMMFPREAKPENRSSGNKASWKLLKALSCKDHASVAVTTPLCAQV